MPPKAAPASIMSPEPLCQPPLAVNQATPCSTTEILSLPLLQSRHFYAGHSFSLGCSSPSDRRSRPCSRMGPRLWTSLHSSSSDRPQVSCCPLYMTGVSVGVLSHSNLCPCGFSLSLRPLKPASFSFSHLNTGLENSPVSPSHTQHRVL